MRQLLLAVTRILEGNCQTYAGTCTIRMSCLRILIGEVPLKSALGLRPFRRMLVAFRPDTRPHSVVLEEGENLTSTTEKHMILLRLGDVYLDRTPSTKACSWVSARVFHFFENVVSRAKKGYVFLVRSAAKSQSVGGCKPKNWL